MKDGEFADSVLVVFGHGTTLNQESGASVLRAAGELNKQRIFAEVKPAFWKQPPLLKDVLEHLQAARVFIAPMFVSEGYFCEKLIPESLGFEVRGDRMESRTLRRPKQTWHYCHPVGTHESMTRVLLDRAQEVVSRFPFPVVPPAEETTLFLAGHGTRQNANSREPIERQAAILTSLRIYAGVHPIFLEESPGIPECYRLAKTRNLVVVPFFIGDGLHVQEDIPVLLGEAKALVIQRLERGKPPWRNPSEKNGKLVWYANPVGTAPGITEVILARVREAAAKPIHFKSY